MFYCYGCKHGISSIADFDSGHPKSPHLISYFRRLNGRGEWIPCFILRWMVYPPNCEDFCGPTQQYIRFRMCRGAASRTHPMWFGSLMHFAWLCFVTKLLAYFSPRWEGVCMRLLCNTTIVWMLNTGNLQRILSSSYVQNLRWWFRRRVWWLHLPRLH